MTVLRNTRKERHSRHSRFALVCLVVALFCPVFTPGSAAEGEPFPLQPPDTSSPRATLESFMHYTAEGVKAYGRGERGEKILPFFQRAERCLDVSQISPDRVRSVATEAGLLLYEVISRVGLPDPAQIPGEAEIEQQDLRVWTVPHTEITLVRIKEGERTGEFLFSAQSVARALEFYDKVKHLPVKPSYVKGTYEQYITRPNFTISYLWADELPAWATHRIFRNPIWKWFAILLTLGVGIAAALAIRRLGRQWDNRFSQRSGQWRIGKLIYAVSLVIIPLLLAQFLTGIVGVRFEVHAILSKSLLALSFAAGVFALFALTEFVAEAIISSRQLRKRSVNAHLIRVVGIILGLIAGLFFVFEAAEYLGLALAPVFAGLGIGGLAVALAARPTIENIIGGFTLFADKPVRVGDYCRFGDEEGTIEEIGLRSTRVRKRDDTVVSIPNADFSQMQLQNNTRRRQWLFKTSIGLRYETTPDQLRFVLAKLRETLISHPKVSADPLYVRFMGFGDYSLNIEMFAYLQTQNWLDYRAIREDLNLRIMDIVKYAGTGFAFPSQTTYFTRDGGLDEDRGAEALQKVEFWRATDKLPFPEFESEEQERMEDTLDYPPKGSPEYVPRASVGDAASVSGTESRPEIKKTKGTEKVDQS